MKKLLLTTITLTAIGVAVKVIKERKKASIAVKKASRANEIALRTIDL
ncbi:hypothetical protein [Pisciglobus halotolerans]|uniref:Uncharacterized protein n=1 Tax=Pisciglobus halotolerans TaxID=745365 RepID=A0A1I3BK17_9LACT|nr:hypothetical protein [Pisciglobus halotolerans]SFH62269.1 hypothetical protein SAMN04489868_10712 [Pisciglobus halotolerans]